MATGEKRDGSKSIFPNSFSLFPEKSSVFELAL